MDFNSTPCRSAGRYLLAVLAAFACCATGSVFANDSSPARREAFRVEDSIEWTTLLPFSPAWSRERNMVLFSPLGTHALLRTRRGSMQRNVNIDELLLYDVGEVQRYLQKSSATDPPQPIVISSVEVARDDDAPSAIQWVGDSQLAFVARSPGGQRQAYVVDVISKSTRQITASGTDVMGFAYAGGVRAHYACVPYDEVKPLVVIVDSFDKALPSIESNARGHCYAETPVELWMGRDDAAAAKVALPAMQLYPWMKRIWLSPDGSHALIVAPAIDTPAHWSAYTGPLRDQAGFGSRFTDPTSMDVLNRTRYMLVELRSGAVRPLLDAPTGQMAGTNSPIEAFWADSGRSVIVTNTFLPLQGDEREQWRRARQPAIAEIELESGAVTPIAWEEVATDSTERVQRRMVGVEWHAHSQVLAVAYERADGSAAREQYLKGPAGWRQSAQAGAFVEPVVIVERQALNERPRMFVEAPVAGRSKLLLDPNPQADQRILARASVVQWTDANGLQWTAGLLLPTSYKAGTRYPLVVQTHGFKPGAFLLDGPTDGLGAGTAFAAQALANAGFVVLQVEDHPEAITFDEREGPAVAEGFRSGIERLIEEGLVDAARVGLCAFSRTGLHALHLLARHPDMLAALTMSDTLTSGYSIFMYNVTQPGVLDELAKLSRAGRPEIDTIGAWFSSEPLYALPKSSAAVRLEGMSQGLGMWEIYSVLKSAGRPVEYVLYPQGSHVLQKPEERLSSQGGNVDWFRFWLQGYEDAAPGKRAMYARWRALRALDSDKARSGAGD